MKVYKYLLSVIVMLGMVSCASEENDIINEVAPAAGQLTVAFNLSNEVATKAVGDAIVPTNGEDNINTCALFICTTADENGEIIEKGFFDRSTCTLNFKPAGTQTNYYVYAVANVSEDAFSGIGKGASVSDLKNVTALIPTTGVKASNLPKMGGKSFEITLNSSNVQSMGEIEVSQLVSSLQLKVWGNFDETAEFVIESMSWAKFSASGKIGGDTTAKNESLYVSSSANVPSSTTYESVGSELYTFPNISENAVLHIVGYIAQNGAQVGNAITKDISFRDVALDANTKYAVNLEVTATLSQEANVTFNYQVIPMQTVDVDVPSFN